MKIVTNNNGKIDFCSDNGTVFDNIHATVMRIDADRENTSCIIEVVNPTLDLKIDEVFVTLNLDEYLEQYTTDELLLISGKIHKILASREE